MTERLGPQTADAVYDELTARIAEPAYRPRALLRRFGIDIISDARSSAVVQQFRRLNAERVGKSTDDPQARKKTPFSSWLR